jgi:hypothetical protein
LTRHRLAPTDNLAPLTDVDDHDGDPGRARSGQNHADRGRCRPSRPHSSRSNAPGEISATDPLPEITPNSVKSVADHP